MKIYLSCIYPRQALYVSSLLIKTTIYHLNWPASFFCLFCLSVYGASLWTNNWCASQEAEEMALEKRHLWGEILSWVTHKLGACGPLYEYRDTLKTP